MGNLPASANEANLKELFDTFSGGDVSFVPYNFAQSNRLSVMART